MFQKYIKIRKPLSNRFQMLKKWTKEKFMLHLFRYCFDLDLFDLSKQQVLERSENSVSILLSPNFIIMFKMNQTINKIRQLLISSVLLIN